MIIVDTLLRICQPLLTIADEKKATLLKCQILLSVIKTICCKRLKIFFLYPPAEALKREINICSEELITVIDVYSFIKFPQMMTKCFN
jgi:hypothetical protein